MISDHTFSRCVISLREKWWRSCHSLSPSTKKLIAAYAATLSYLKIGNVNAMARQSWQLFGVLPRVSALTRLYYYFTGRCSRRLLSDTASLFGSHIRIYCPQRHCQKDRRATTIASRHQFMIPCLNLKRLGIAARAPRTAHASICARNEQNCQHLPSRCGSETRDRHT